jgi:hypothetical protein
MLMAFAVFWSNMGPNVKSFKAVSAAVMVDALLYYIGGGWFGHESCSLLRIKPGNAIRA